MEGGKHASPVGDVKLPVTTLFPFVSDAVMVIRQRLAYISD